MENNKRIQRVKAAPRKLIIKKNINAIKSSKSALFSKLPRKKNKAQADQRLPYRHCVNVN